MYLLCKYEVQKQYDNVTVVKADIEQKEDIKMNKSILISIENISKVIAMSSTLQCYTTRYNNL